MKHGSLFSGIGGFDLAAQWMGWENVFQVEIDEFCQKVLAKKFPNTKRYSDIRTFDGKQYTGQIDIITGGFPCQPFSVAGKRKGTEDERFLWHEMLRAIKEISPCYVVAENVPGLLSQQRGMVFEQVCSEMENIGYEIQTIVIPACAVNAPHRRDRIWIIANSTSNGLETVQQRHGKTLEVLSKPPNNFERLNAIKRTFGERNNGELRNGDGLSDWMDRLKSLGNAIVPQVAFQIFKAIEQTSKLI